MIPAIDPLPSALRVLRCKTLVPRVGRLSNTGSRLRTRESLVRVAGTLVWLLTAFALLVAAHWPLLRLPYYWDEAGYYIPAAYDFLRRGTLIPYSTLSNAHPPLLSIYLASWWRLLRLLPVCDPDSDVPGSSCWRSPPSTVWPSS